MMKTCSTISDPPSSAPVVMPTIVMNEKSEGRERVLQQHVALWTRPSIGP